MRLVLILEYLHVIEYDQTFTGAEISRLSCLDESVQTDPENSICDQ